MRKLFCLIALFLSMSASASTAFYHPYYYYFGTWSGYPVGWGYVFHPTWPADYWGNLGWNGYSYFPFFNYGTVYASYAVISYSPVADTWGSSWGQVSRNMASRVANSYCGDAACKPVVWVQGGCAALMTSSSTSRVTWGTGVNREAAVYAASRACHSNGSGQNDCTERAWVCSF